MAASNRKACPPPAEGGFLKALYGGSLSWLLPLLSAKWVSNVAGSFMDSRLSTPFIKGFIESNGIDMTEYPVQKYRSFNHFFTREILAEKRPGRRSSAPEDLISPADSRLTVYPIGDDLTFRIKYGTYSAASLVGDKALAEEYKGGWCMVFRLSVDDFHRYCFFDSGSMGETRRIECKYYTVQPIALRSHDYFKENVREVTVLHTDHFGKALCIEIGATFVGRICNRKGISRFERGEEKGMFEFGGSTVVLLLKKDATLLDSDILDNSEKGAETRVRIGEVIGHKA